MTTDRIHATPARTLASAALKRPARAIALMLASAVLVAGVAEAQPREQGRFFERLDTNGDGIIDAEELRASRRAAFERADEDGDGFISGDEIERLADDRAERAHERRGGIVGGIGRRRMPDAGPALDRLDADSDGRVSEAEFVEAEHPLLERFDANADGAITRDEVDQAQARMRRHVERRRTL